MRRIMQAIVLSFVIALCGIATPAMAQSGTNQMQQANVRLTYDVKSLDLDHPVVFKRYTAWNGEEWVPCHYCGKIITLHKKDLVSYRFRLTPHATIISTSLSYATVDGLRFSDEYDWDGVHPLLRYRWQADETTGRPELFVTRLIWASVWFLDPTRPVPPAKGGCDEASCQK
jgi:uncharacterized Zn-finger protein